MAKSHKTSQSERQIKAAKLLFEDRLTDEQIASECGVTRRQVARWKKDFQVVTDEMERLRAKAAEGAGRATEQKAFVTTDRLIELANLPPAITNGTIGGQVKACGVIAQIRGEITHKTEDVTPKTPEERKVRALAMLREGAQRVGSVN